VSNEGPYLGTEDPGSGHPLQPSSDEVSGPEPDEGPAYLGRVSAWIIGCRGYSRQTGGILRGADHTAVLRDKRHCFLPQ
jgi:hypothetical protein